MTAKFVKKSVLSVGFISAISAIPFLAGLPGNAQTASPQMNNSPSQINGQPSQIDPSPSQIDQPLNQPSQNTAPTPSNGLGGTSANQAPVLSLGSRGESVRQVQTLLQQQGLYNGLIDGIYGLQTRNAVVAFQRSRNLIADGIIGSSTWTVMLNSPNQASAF
ncbi:peptidoglycan-binding domain-containing protein [Argonema antarcticum]|uniref:peptidoglycan-binding domain-containing protein n=1 Tax=Argonema antarcticum TaxID=2942763 RepID=UPI002013BC97|nr:peptidoglycan-binding protein [Argonema antarcticum]MCL1473903.1 peptidoglycan-binding protein [Argonema antarcticum A004/B2]